jgi:hypothetical protein
MPGNDRRRLDDRQRIGPASPQSRNDNPEGSVNRTKAGTRGCATQDREPLAEHDVFQDRIGPGTERSERGPGNRHQYRQPAVTLAPFGHGVAVESDPSFG